MSDLDHYSICGDTKDVPIEVADKFADIVEEAFEELLERHRENPEEDSIPPPEMAMILSVYSGIVSRNMMSILTAEDTPDTDTYRKTLVATAGLALIAVYALDKQLEEYHGVSETTTEGMG